MSAARRFRFDDPPPERDNRLKCSNCECLGPLYLVPYNRKACLPGVMPATSEFERLCSDCCRRAGVRL